MNNIKYFFSIAGGAILAYLKMYGVAFSLVAVAVFFDVVTGVLASVANGSGLSSGKAYKGLIKKLILFVALGFGTFLDVLIPYACKTVNFNIPSNLLFSTVICVYITVTESISIIENIYKASGSALPKWILKMLKSAKSDMDKEGENDDKSTGNG